MRATYKNSLVLAEVVREDGWQAAIFGGRDCPSLLAVAHHPASAASFYDQRRIIHAGQCN